MHKNRIIHYDIKPQNICFSEERNKFVLIDFGFSEILNVKLGYKTMTGFRGSAKYCSE